MSDRERHIRKLEAGCWREEVRRPETEENVQGSVFRVLYLTSSVTGRGISMTGSTKNVSGKGISMPGNKKNAQGEGTTMPGNKKIESGKGSTVTASASNMKWGNPVTGGRVPVCCGGHKHWDITFSEKQVDISIQSNVFGVSNSEPRAHNPRTTAQIVPPHPSVDGYPLNIPLSSSRRPYADISPLEGKESGWIYLMEGNGSCTGTYSISQFNELEYGHFSSFKEESTTQLWEVVQLSAHNSGSKTLNFNLESISPSRRVGSYNKTSCFAWLKQTGKSKLIKSEYQKSYVYANFLPLKGKEGYTGTVTNTLKQKHAYET